MEASAPPLNTTIGVVATTASLTKAECSKFASVAHDGLARAIRPVHSMLDGDTIFVLATGGRTLASDPGQIGVLAADVMARAIVRAANAATSVDGYPALRDLGR